MTQLPHAATLAAMAGRAATRLDAALVSYQEALAANTVTDDVLDDLVLQIRQIRDFVDKVAARLRRENPSSPTDFDPAKVARLVSGCMSVIGLSQAEAENVLQILAQARAGGQRVIDARFEIAPATEETVTTADGDRLRRKTPHAGAAATALSAQVTNLRAVIAPLIDG